MADRTPIEWTDATWCVTRGCERVDEGCRNCYAEVMAARFSKPGQWGHGLATIIRRPDGTSDHRWTGKVVFVEDQLDQPLRWKKPRRIFVDSTSDLFHRSITDEQIDRVFAVMALCPQHTFQVLTKRPDRARAYIDKASGRIGDRTMELRRSDVARRAGMGPSIIGPVPYIRPGSQWWPLANVWLGTSVSDQASADLRIHELLATPAAVRFLSVEPMLGPVDLTHINLPVGGGRQWIDARQPWWRTPDECTRLNWVICGGESGPHARPMHPDWARSLRDQCVAAGVPFFFKQWGEWLPMGQSGFTSWSAANVRNNGMFGKKWLGFAHFNDGAGGPNTAQIGPCETCNIADFLQASRVGKRAAGRLLDGRTWNEVPEGRG